MSRAANLVEEFIRMGEEESEEAGFDKDLPKPEEGAAAEVTQGTEENLDDQLKKEVEALEITLANVKKRAEGKPESDGIFVLVTAIEDHLRALKGPEKDEKTFAVTERRQRSKK